MEIIFANDITRQELVSWPNAEGRTLMDIINCVCFLSDKHQCPVIYIIRGGSLAPDPLWVEPKPKDIKRIVEPECVE